MSSRLLAITLSALFAILLLPAPADASEASANLQALHRLHLAAQKSLGDFYMYNGMEGDQRYARMIADSLRVANQQLQQLTNMPGERSTRLNAQLKQSWSDYEGQLTTLMNALKSQGYTELQPVADMAARNRQVLDDSLALQLALQREGAFQAPPLVARSRQQSLLMQAIAVNYAARSASVGATFFGGNSEQPIEELVGEFARQLASLRETPQNTPQIASTLASVSSKWRYIEKSLQNYNENSVPFLVNKYSDSIIAGLEEVSSQYAAVQP